MRRIQSDTKSTMRGLAILALGTSFLAATILWHPQKVKAVTTYYCYTVVVVAEGNGGTDEDCHSFGYACSEISCGDARVAATQQAIQGMSPSCQMLPYHWEYEDCQEYP
jgi:hypothetical protein